VPGDAEADPGAVQSRASHWPVPVVRVLASDPRVEVTMAGENMVMSPEHYHEQVQAVRRAELLEVAVMIEKRGTDYEAVLLLHRMANEVQAAPFSAGRLRNEPWLMGGGQQEERDS